MPKRLYWMITVLLLAAGLHRGAAAADGPDFAQLVEQDGAIAHWRLDDTGRSTPGLSIGEAAGALSGDVRGATLGHAGPRSPRYLGFDEKNTAASFGGNGDRIVIAGDQSSLKFDKGDSITIEAWVNPRGITNGQQVYIVGKGRTHNGGYDANNQNWSLRLRGDDGRCCISFLFRDAVKRPAAQSGDSWHRWTSGEGFLPNTGWHHVAVTYTFGKGDSIRGYIDGKPVGGAWDMGGASDEAPVVDDDEVWIGSAMGGSAGNSFNGLIDEVAIYRKALPAERIALCHRLDPDAPEPQLAAGPPLLKRDELPDDAVVVEIIEDIAETRNWNFPISERAVETHTLKGAALGFIGFPTKYNRKALIVDRSWPYLVRATGKVKLDAGEHRVLVRAHNSARLFIDDELITSTRFTPRNAGGHEAVPDLPAAEHPDLRPLPVGQAENVETVTLKGGEHVFRLEVVVGGKGIRPEVGELFVAVAGMDEDELFRVVGPSVSFPLTDRAWEAYAEGERRRLAAIDRDTRLAADEKEREYWAKRHEWVREQLKGVEAPAPSEVSGDMPANNAIDRFIGARLVEAGVKPTALVDDYAFVRRVYLDAVGVIPTPEEIDAFINDDRPDKRARLIDRLLDDPRWADHWVAYWQDVLAENPGILKPMLNNTGPFRYFIYEAFLDNKPIDRFVTELILMEGSTYQGGPAGFAMATQNDVPMAAKAHVIGTAFLGVEMKCARCHDAPFHPFKQEQLFSMAAMLKRGAEKVPASSSVPAAATVRGLLIEVSLKPGQSVAPDWPFEQLAHDEPDAMLVRDAGDERERLAAIITSPQNERFTQVIANRLWKRYLGWGLVEPADDWDSNKPSHPGLLAWLGHELAVNGYDVKHLARLIFNSHAYQRATTGDAAQPPAADKRLFTGPARRRMTAEQVVDSLFVAAGKSFNSEEMNLDNDGRRPITTFLNLGVPRRAWQFASLSNERDRPALSMPHAQDLTDVLKTFGWRETRQDPITVRDQTPTMLQPLVLANSIAGFRATTLSDDHALTAVAVRDVRLDELVQATFQRVLSRRATDQEMQLFASLLSDGFGDRVDPDAPPAVKVKPRHAVSWSNHLSAEASKIKLEVERAARAGDPPTNRLRPDWRKRMEDMVWTLVNSPEFVFVP